MWESSHLNFSVKLNITNIIYHRNESTKKKHRAGIVGLFETQINVDSTKERRKERKQEEEKESESEPIKNDKHTQHKKDQKIQGQR